MASQTPPGQESSGQPSEEEMRAYLAQLREADPVEIVAQAYTMLGTGAEVKLGRPDARTLIDALAGLVESVQARLPADLVERMRGGLTQLQMAQVESEQSGDSPPSGSPSAQERPDQPSGREPQEGGSQDPPQTGSSQTGPPQSGSSRGGDPNKMTDRLWIPGRDPRP